MALENNFFYMIVGLVQPNSGNIYLDDLNITDYPMYKRAQQESDIWHKKLLF
jgi:ABC-type lipopolysaccharide export system ATPase subunit